MTDGSAAGGRAGHELLPYGPLMTATLRPLQRGFLILNRGFMAPLIRAGFGWLLGNPLTGHYLVLVTRGRRTGLRREAPLGYVIRDGSVYVVAGYGRTTPWYRNLLDDPAVEVILPTRRFRGRAAPVEDPREWVAAYRDLIGSFGLLGRAVAGDVQALDDDALRAAAWSPAGGTADTGTRASGSSSRTGSIPAGAVGWCLARSPSRSWCSPGAPSATFGPDRRFPAPPFELDVRFAGASGSRARTCSPAIQSPATRPRRDWAARDWPAPGGARATWPPSSADASDSRPRNARPPVVDLLVTRACDQYVPRRLKPGTRAGPSLGESRIRSNGPRRPAPSRPCSPPVTNRPEWRTPWPALQVEHESQASAAWSSRRGACSRDLGEVLLVVVEDDPHHRGHVELAKRLVQAATSPAGVVQRIERRDRCGAQP